MKWRKLQNLKKRPETLSSAGRPNSPPLEVLTKNTTCRTGGCELHFCAMLSPHLESGSSWAHGAIASLLSSTMLRLVAGFQGAIDAIGLY
jgi:hypothetical protein